MTLLIVLLACSSGPGSSHDSGVDLGDNPSAQPLPDLSGVDLPGAFADALQRAQGVTLSTAWTGHVASMAHRTNGCPDLYLGGIQDADLGDNPAGLTWYDYCQPAGGGSSFSGWVYWDGSVDVTGQPGDKAGQTVDASRELSGDGLVGRNRDNTAFELRGDATESVYSVTAPDYQTWTWQSEIQATVTGSDAFADSQGWRADLYMSASGGDAATLELRGNAYFFAPVIAGRFDSIDADLVFGSDPDCTLEPHGWLSVRDPDAVWYDLVFLPLDGAADTGTDAGTCDGCGTLYVRGLETVEYGQVCPDLGGWSVPATSVPDPNDFLLTLRQVLDMEGG